MADLESWNYELIFSPDDISKSDSISYLDA